MSVGCPAAMPQRANPADPVFPGRAANDPWKLFYSSRHLTNTKIGTGLALPGSATLASGLDVHSLVLSHIGGAMLSRIERTMHSLGSLREVMPADGRL